MVISKFKKHIPFHLYVNEGIYFVTSGTINKNRFFDNDNKLDIILKRLNLAVKKFNLKLYAWVILSNHYHILFNLKLGKELSKLIRFINGGSAFDLNKLEDRLGRKIWWNYWDRNIREESSLYKRINYIHHNPVKHGYVKQNKNYKYSSYSYYKEKYGDEFLYDIESRYPIIDFTDINDEL